MKYVSIKVFGLMMFLTATACAGVPTAALSARSPSAVRGGSDGGGGNAVLCYKDVKVRNQVFKSMTSSSSPFDYVDLRLNLLQERFKPQLLDLWDARKAFGFPGAGAAIELNDLTPEQVYSALTPVLESLGKLLFGQNNETVNEFLIRNRTTPAQWKAEENGVIRIEDATIQSHFPENCLVAQVAFYDDTTGIVHYDARILRLMSNVDMNALRVHEDIYHAVRARGLQLSDARERMKADIDAAYNSPAYRNGATVDTSGLLKLAQAIAKTKTSDLTRQLVANLFTSKKFDEVTVKKLTDAIVY